MELDRASKDLYRVAPADFTKARDTMATEARQEGRTDLASSLKKLRKPSVGAWMANLLALEQSDDVRRLVDLGEELRRPNRRLDGEQIRRVSKEKGDAVSKLVRGAHSRASRAGQTVSTAASQELEATLDAAFADPKAAESLLEGRLSSGLRYSGLGFGDQPAAPSPKGTAARTSGRRVPSKADQIDAARDLEKAQHEAEQADTLVAKARKAVAETAEELTRLKAAEALAVRRAKAAHAKVTSAEKKRRPT